MDTSYESIKTDFPLRKQEGTKEQMRIGIDAHMVGTKETGNETYIRNLIDNLAKIDKENEYVIFVSDGSISEHWRLGNTNFVFDTVSPSNLFRISLQFWMKVKKHHLDVMHFTYHLPLFCPCKTVVTVHDICFKKFPHCFSKRDRFVLTVLGKSSARKADAVITVSNSSKGDIEEFYGLDSRKIYVTYEAANEDFFNAGKSKLASVCAKYAIDTDFILAVGNIQPRKNLASLVKAFGMLVDKTPFSHKLVLVGKALFRELDVFQEIVKWGLVDRVVFTGYVEDRDLPSLYAAAHLFVYPSVYEGFGLPLLEAMACGTPVIASKTSSIPEVVGDAALMIDPYDVSGIANAIGFLLSNEAIRRQMSQKGLRQARMFNWETTAAETLKVYDTVHKIGKWR